MTAGIAPEPYLIDIFDGLAIQAVFRQTANTCCRFQASDAQTLLEKTGNQEKRSGRLLKIKLPCIVDLKSP